MNPNLRNLSSVIMVLGFMACKSTSNDTSGTKTIVPLKPGTQITHVVQKYAIDPDLQAQLANEFRDTMRMAVVDRPGKGKVLALYYRKVGTQVNVDTAIYFSETWKEGDDLVDIDILYTDEATKRTEIVGSAYYDMQTKMVTVNRLCNEEFSDVCDLNFINAKIDFKLNP